MDSQQCNQVYDLFVLEVVLQMDDDLPTSARVDTRGSWYRPRSDSSERPVFLRAGRLERRGDRRRQAASNASEASIKTPKRNAPGAEYG